LRRSLERCDSLVNLRNQEIATLNSRLAAKDETIADAAEQCDRLDLEVTQLRSQLATERASREEIEAELSDLKQNSAPASQELPEPADLLNQLKTKRKKSTATLADIEAILEMIEKSCDDTSREN
jgi:chromosome segregation ATPase